jgi:hypothetical protein
MPDSWWVSILDLVVGSCASKTDPAMTVIIAVVVAMPRVKIDFIVLPFQLRSVSKELLGILTMGLRLANVVVQLEGLRKKHLLYLDLHKDDDFVIALVRTQLVALPTRADDDSTPAVILRSPARREQPSRWQLCGSCQLNH